MCKKLLIMIVISVIITSILGCQGKGIDGALGKSVIITNPQTSETVKNTGSNEKGTKTNDKDNTSIIIKAHSVSKDEIVSYFALTKEEILRKLGPDYRVIPTGAEGSYEGYQYSNIGLIFVFEEDKVGFIICDDKVEINGARAGMNFTQIKEKLGEAKIEETWYETPDNKAYKISYTINNCVFQFKSYNKDGSNSSLTVYRKKPSK